jgi:hypothetical protein
MHLTDCVDESGGAAGLMLECLRACNHDVRLKASRNIIFIGEGAMIPGNGVDVCFFIEYVRT